jgi:seryl-tRNA synthetase
MDFKNRDKIDQDLRSRGIKLEWWETREDYMQHRRYCDHLRKQYNSMASTSSDRAEQKKLKEQIQSENLKLHELQKTWDEKMSNIPVGLHKSVPHGTSEKENKVIKQNGQIIFLKHHYEMNIFHPCDVVGTRFVVLKDKIAKLERALLCFMMDFLSEELFEEFSIPYFVNSTGCFNSGNLIEKDNMFSIEEKFLIPTSEVILVNLSSKIISQKNLPLKFSAASDCFRKEAGAAGKDTRGLIRLHQFKKCEMVCFSEPEKSYDLLEQMVQVSCQILEKLGIPYRYIVLCSGDTSIKSAKTYDIEIPIGGQWREVSSISNCETFQTHRMKIKCQETGELLHSLNGSALAVGRTLASLLEVFYEKEENIVKIPECLWKYTGFRTISV